MHNLHKQSECQTTYFSIYKAHKEMNLLTVPQLNEFTDSPSFIYALIVKYIVANAIHMMNIKTLFSEVKEEN